MMPTSTSNAEAPCEDDAGRARDWWGARELEVERELVCSLQRRMEAQRAQLYAFKTEQSKWEHELQLRISKYAHDRKLLSEHNVELQEALTAMEEKFAVHQREMDMLTQHVIELEGLLNENHIDTQQIHELQKRNEELSQRLRNWERFYRADKVVLAEEQKKQQEELLEELEQLLAVSEEELVSRQRAGSSNERGDAKNTDELARKARTRRGRDTEDDPLVVRIKELEAACKQKDQTIHSLKSVLEQQDTTFDEKLKITTAKYDQVKTINMALQKRLMQALTEVAAKP
ncbi:hypothetical protein PHYBOEH_000665 [Phytophthora boehmeriae]|uniref:Uncharacterized protein n=1 Tax=Phytophthora boehmeriae TaxID=109152 RepID=A0A8T1X0E2_9STRA|nr:hypothetical protein PHYBOEH_000665 [Phytophthora boehmeriae]